MRNYLYVDNSNVWIEGMHVRAVAEGLAPDIWTAQQQRITVPWKMDFGRLFEFAAGTDRSQIGRAVLYGSRPPPNDSLWRSAERKGFEVVVHDRRFGREKKVDINIATDIMADSFQRMQPGDEVTLVSGDSDFVPTIENVRGRGFDVHLVFWDHSSQELKSACSSFTSLNRYIGHLTIG